MGVIKESSKARMQNTGPVSQPGAMRKKLPGLVPAQLPPRPMAQAPAPCLPPVLPPVPTTPQSPCPGLASVASYSGQPGPLPTSCPDRLPPLTSFAPPHLPAWVTSPLACPPTPPSTCLPPLPLPLVRRPFRLAPLFSQPPPFIPEPAPHPAFSPTCRGFGPR